MKRAFSCPHCEALLNPEVKIILRAEVKGNRGLLLFSPQPGNYDVVAPEGLTLRKRDKVNLACPVCGRDLTSRKGADWAEIKFRAAETEGRVIFSKIYGHHATYFVTKEEVRSYGEDAREAVNFWGAGPRGPE